jgi:glycosyltransferase involved in cell wall biosynthesis
VRFLDRRIDTVVRHPGGPVTERHQPPALLVLSNMYPSPSDPVFGSFVAKQVDALRTAGSSVRVVASAKGRAGALGTLARYLGLAVRIKVAALFHRDFDVIVAHFLYPTAWLARMASLLSGRPYVVIAHGQDVTSVQGRGVLAKLSLSATRRASLVVAVSRALEVRVRSELDLPASVPSAVINMGVDRCVFSPSAGEGARVTLGWSIGDKVAVFAGNLIERKGVDVLVEAFSQLHARGACDRLAIAGDGPLRDLLVLQASALGVAKDVEFLGAVEAASLARLMASADVFVLPSRSEPLGVVLLEAMACGTPVVASSVGGIPEIVGEGCGVLVEPDDAAALVTAMESVLANGKDVYATACLDAAAANDVNANAARLLDAVAKAQGKREVRR